MSNDRKPLVTNAANPKQVKKAESKERHIRQEEINDLVEVLNLSAGRRVIWRLLGECGISKTSFDPSGSRVYFNEGMRNIGLFIQKEIEIAAPEAYMKMLEEDNEARKKEG